MKEIMEILSKNGYESYIVGGYVRDYLLGVPSYDVDICTNAPIEKIEELFDGQGKSYRQFFAYHLSKGEYEFDITTYRIELRYKKNKPIELQIAPNLYKDLLRRDFTINTFAMDIDGNFIDLLGSKKDLDNKIIRCVGDTDKRFNEDKTRIIRALRFSCTLDFDLSKEIVDFIEKKSYLLNEVPKEYKRKELDKIFDSIGLDKFLYIIKSLNIEKYFNISFDKIVHAYNKYGIYSQMEFDLPFSNNELKIINTIRSLVDKKDISYEDFNSYEDDIIMNAACILNQMGRIKTFKDIKKYHSVMDIDIDIDVLFKYVHIDDIVDTYKLIEKGIVEGYIKNDREDIEDFLKDL